MMSVWYGPYAMIDQATGQVAGEGADVQFFDPSDTSFATPLTVTDLAGVPYTTMHIARAATPGFYGPDGGTVVARSGTYVTVVQAVEGLQQKADASANSAAASADSAAQSAAAAQAAQAAAEAAATAPTEAAVVTAVNGQDFTPTGTWDYSGATVTGLPGGGTGGSDVTVTDGGDHYTLGVDGSDYDVPKTGQPVPVESVTGVSEFARTPLATTDAQGFRTAIGAVGSTEIDSAVDTAVGNVTAASIGAVPTSRKIGSLTLDADVSSSQLAQQTAAATTGAQGVVELATVDEAKDGTDTARAVTPAGLTAVVDAASLAAENLPIIVVYDYANDTWPDYSTDQTRVRNFRSQGRAAVSANPVAYNADDQWDGVSA